MRFIGRGGSLVTCHSSLFTIRYSLLPLPFRPRPPGLRMRLWRDPDLIKVEHENIVLPDRRRQELDRVRRAKIVLCYQPVRPYDLAAILAADTDSPLSTGARTSR